MHRLSQLILANAAILTMVAFTAGSLSLGEVATRTDKKGIKEYLDKYSKWTRCWGEDGTTKASPDVPIGKCPTNIPIDPNDPRTRVPTYSYEQTGSQFESGGICGQVGLSNIALNFCGLITYPPEVWDMAIQPGYLRGTNIEQLARQLKKLLDHADCEAFAPPRGPSAPYGYSFGVRVAPLSRDNIVRSGSKATWNGSRRLRSLAWAAQPYPDEDGTFRRSFMPVLVRLERGGEAHVTTVVGVFERDGTCEVVHNTWMGQYRTSCTRFADLATDMIYIITLKVVRAWYVD